jgi:hypothetical protein
MDGVQDIQAESFDSEVNMMKSIENLRLAEGMGVEATPTTKVFCSGSEVGEIVGYRSFDDAVAEIETIIKECP